MGKGRVGVAPGDLVRQFRESAGYTQADLAKATGISVRALRDIEQGRVARPRPGSLNRLVEALHLDGDDRDQIMGVRSPLSISILGPLECTWRGVPVALGSGAQSRILGLLALEADRFVSVDEIVDMLWGAHPPAQWRNRIQVHVSNLRRLLQPDRRPGEPSVVLLAGENGYRLTATPDQLDAGRFRELCVQAAAATPAEAARLYHRALSCWRGRVLEGDDGQISARPAAVALWREKVQAALALAVAADESGQMDLATVRLESLAREEPLHELVQSTLMQALVRTGQQDRAIDVYLRLRERLSTELGVEPTTETQLVYRGILQRSSEGEPSKTMTPRPAQLPMATPYFAGREAAVSVLVDHLCGPTRVGEIAGPRIVVVHGMPGVGKTSLVLHIGHRLRKRYPDGQLFADIRGENDEPAAPGEVVAAFLRALGVAPDAVPADMDERCAMLRSHLAGKRILMVLDDVRNAVQVLPLLPSDAGNDVLITSRHALAELPVTRYLLEPLTVSDSLEVLAQFVSPERLTAEHDAAGEVAGYCAGLPLALQIAAGRLQTGASMAEMARLLSDSNQRVKELRGGHLAVVRSLESSLRSLSALAQAALRRIAILPHRAVPAWAIGIALGVARDAAQRVLTELVTANLLNPVGLDGQHYAMHDLVRLYAQGQVTDSDAGHAKDVVVQWFHLAHAMSLRITKRRINAGRLNITPAKYPLQHPAEDPNLWFDVECQQIVDVLLDCAARGESQLAAGFVNVLTPYLAQRYRVDQWEKILDAAGQAARQAGDRMALGYVLESAVRRHIKLLDWAAGQTVAEEALALFTRDEDLDGRCHLLYHLQYLKRRLGDIDGAVAIADELVQRYESLGDDGGLASAHHALGMLHREYLHDLDKARHHFELALAIASSDTASREYSQIAFSLGTVYIRHSEPAKAEPLLAHALRYTRSTGDAIATAYVTSRLSDLWEPARAAAALDDAFELAVDSRETQAILHQAYARLHERTGRISESLPHLQKALAIYESLGTPSAAQPVREEIERLRAARATT